MHLKSITLETQNIVLRLQIKIHTVLPGQLLKLHICVSVCVPWHAFPPAEGEGLLQVLDLVLVPLRQDTVHVFQLFQSFHMPSAVT